MKSLAALLLVLVFCPALAQTGPGRPHGYGGPYGQRGAPPGNYMQRGGPPPGNFAPREFQRPMPPPERRMSWDERQRLREQVRNGEMTRDEARQRWREQRGLEPGRFSLEQRDQLRRDVQEANRDLERR